MDVTLSKEKAENVVRVTAEKGKVISKDVGTSNKEAYHLSLKRTIDAHLQKSFDEEIQKANQEMTEERQRAINEIIMEQQTVIKKAVEEEKRAIWARAAETNRRLLAAE